jgi:8-oxo-dGTP diphosphatase
MIMDNKKTAIVEAIIKDSKGRILLLKRSNNNKKFINKWQLPGGKVDFGENVQNAIRREIKEETGCFAIKPVLERVFSVLTKFDGKDNKVLLLVYSVKIKGRIKISDEHIEYKYFFKDEIKKSSLMKLSKISLFSKK